MDNRTIEEVKRNESKLIQEVKRLEIDNQKLDSCLTEYTSLYKGECNKISKSLEINEKIIEEYKNVYGNNPSKLLLSLQRQNEILKGDGNE